MLAVPKNNYSFVEKFIYSDMGTHACYKILEKPTFSFIEVNLA